jgi:hypothetical protein
MRIFQVLIPILKSASFVLPKFVKGFSGILKEFSGKGVYLSPEIHETLMNPSV